MKYIFVFTSSEDGITFTEDRFAFTEGSVPYIPQQVGHRTVPVKQGMLALRSEIQERPEATFQVGEINSAQNVTLTDPYIQK